MQETPAFKGLKYHEKQPGNVDKFSILQAFFISVLVEKSRKKWYTILSK